MSPLELLLLYVAFRAKQMICDFFLQPTWMATGKDLPWGEGGARALLTHAGIHGAFTFFVVILFAPTLWWLGLVDFLVHGAIDRFKARALKKRNIGWQHSWWWWAYGLDQEAHNLTHLIYIVVIVWVGGGLCLPAR